MKSLFKNLNLKKVSVQALALSMALPAPSFAITFDGKDKPQTNKFIEAHMLDSLPFVFTIPKARQIEFTDAQKAKIKRSDALMFDFRHSELPDSGLRIYFANNSPRDRQGIMKDLKDNGLLQSGDVVLKFHPEWGFTGGYPTVMAGISHAGYIYEKNGKLYNADMPLNAEFNQDMRDASEPSSLSSSVWQQEAHYVHILRPKKSKMGPREIENAANWAHKLVTERKRVYPGNICFNSNYLIPGYALNPSFQEAIKSATTLEQKLSLLTKHSKEIGAIATKNREITTWLDSKTLGEGQRPGFTSQVCVFCSDFAWSMAALGNCDYDARNPSVRSCEPKPLFAPIPVIGNGPANTPQYVPGVADLSYLILSASTVEPAKAAQMVQKAFTPLKPLTNISSGHREASKSIPTELYENLAKYTAALITGQIDGANQIRAGIKAAMNVPENYSPNAFLVNSVLPEGNPYKAYDYVATVAFPSASEQKKVVRLAQQEQEGGSPELIAEATSNAAGIKAVPTDVANNPALKSKVFRCTGVVNWGNGYVPAMGRLGFGDCQDVRVAITAIDSDWESYVNNANTLN